MAGAGRVLCLESFVEFHLSTHAQGADGVDVRRVTDLAAFLTHLALGSTIRPGGTKGVGND